MATFEPNLDVAAKAAAEERRRDVERLSRFDDYEQYPMHAPRCKWSFDRTQACICEHIMKRPDYDERFSGEAPDDD